MTTTQGISCPTCSGEMTLTSLERQEYWYCRPCKKEFAELMNLTPPPATTIVAPVQDPSYGKGSHGFVYTGTVLTVPAAPMCGPSGHFFPHMSASCECGHYA